MVIRPWQKRILVNGLDRPKAAASERLLLADLCQLLPFSEGLQSNVDSTARCHCQVT
ncbi:hypothetical protein EMIT0P260_30197 [Pseudomonas sp. IT-P260]